MRDASSTLAVEGADKTPSRRPSGGFSKSRHRATMPKAHAMPSLAEILGFRPQYSLQGPKLVACVQLKTNTQVLEKSGCLDIVLGIHSQATVAVARQSSPELRSMNVANACDSLLPVPMPPP